MVKASDFAAQGAKYLGRSYQEMDCQAFVEKCLADVGIKKDWPGSNGMARSCAWRGTPEECVKKYGKVPVGALLFIHYPSGSEPAKYKADGLGDFGHVGINLTGKGDQGAIHSSSSRGMVAYSKFNSKSINGGWNTVGLWDFLDYGLEDKAEDKPKEETNMETNAEIYAENGLPVNFREEPKIGGRAIAQLPVGTLITVTGGQGEWAEVVYNGQAGYVMDKFIRKMDQSVPQTTATTTSTGDVSGLEARVAALEDKMDKLWQEWTDKMGWG